MNISNEYEIIQENELNVYKNVHLFLYTYSGEDLLLLLPKKDQQNLKEFDTEILSSDELPTFAVSRLMATTYRGLFTKNNEDKLLRKEELSNEDIFESDEYHWHSIWSNGKFIEWLDKISDNPIQFDRFKGKMIYFLEMPQIDIEFLNKNLEKLEYKYKFEYLKYNFNQIVQSSNVELNLDTKTHEMMKKFDFDAHIKNTIKLFAEDNIDYYIILACKKPGDKKDQAGFFHFPALIPGIYRTNNEKWIYLVASSDLPDDKLMSKCKAIIIPGSELNIYNELEFLRKTEDFVRNMLTNYPKVKLLGLCFGMQLLVNALGGEVVNMGQGVFVHGGEKLIIDDDFWNFEFVKKSKVDKTVSLVIRQAHGDHVSIMPHYDTHKIKNYAHSETCQTEILVSDDERLFCIQGHPEYETDFSLCRAAEWICIRSKLEPTPENKILMKEAAKKNEKYPKINSVELRRLCNSFLKTEK